jgi:outer membrane protein OmpA-like peptidoglycan-associated protein
MTRRWFNCPLCTLLGLAGLGLLAWLLIGTGQDKAQQVRARTEADATRLLAVAGFPWARLQIDDDVGRLVGEAPSLVQRTAARAAASTMLLPMMGVPGVFARLEDAQTSPDLELPTLPTPASAVVPTPVPAKPAASAVSPRVAASGPLTVEDCQIAMAQAVERQQIRFRVASAELDPASEPVLRELHGLSMRCPQARIRVEGHTDTNGAPDFNLRLSQRRAAAVVDALVRAGVPRARLESRGFGEERPLDPADTPEAHERNRRIEFHLATRDHKAS